MPRSSPAVRARRCGARSALSPSGHLGAGRQRRRRADRLTAEQQALVAVEPFDAEDVVVARLVEIAYARRLGQALAIADAERADDDRCERARDDDLAHGLVAALGPDIPDRHPGLDRLAVGVFGRDELREADAPVEAPYLLDGRIARAHAPLCKNSWTFCVVIGLPCLRGATGSSTYVVLSTGGPVRVNSTTFR